MYVMNSAENQWEISPDVKVSIYLYCLNWLWYSIITHKIYTKCERAVVVEITWTYVYPPTQSMHITTKVMSSIPVSCDYNFILEKNIRTNNRVFFLNLIISSLFLCYCWYVRLFNVAFSFTDGENRNTRRKPTCNNSLTYFITLCCN